MDNNTNDKKVRAARLRAIRKGINAILPYKDNLRDNIKTIAAAQKKTGQLGSDIYALGVTHPFGLVEATATHKSASRHYYMTLESSGILSLGWYNGPVGSGVPESAKHHAVSIHVFNLEERNASAAILNGFEKYEHIFKSNNIVDEAVTALPILAETLVANIQKAADIVTGDSPEKRAAVH